MVDMVGEAVTVDDDLDIDRNRNVDRNGPYRGARVRLFTQDATAELPKGKLPLWSDGSASSSDPHCDLIVCNPPWGKNIGKHEDGGPIVLSLCRQFVGVTMVLLVNKYTRAVPP